ncbi:patatin-like phospholipase family protein [Halomarina oriensis]|uniref:Patatin-like phospholipase family protein n=1 Tax=Halomarina oriensis TaxID=671145 RepID=A0A6B0GMK6_9EURY|nr:patatin-like phospholipase family protein [Halomarina oriensis]MWG34887.1 patatin-like phospholipase family protein [Halomarina oriensis]
MVTNVAIACQGGGSHTAFTAGALRELLPPLDASPDHRLVGISGTSGGALSALAAWYGLESDGPRYARRLLREAWMDLCAGDPVDWWANEVTVTTARLTNGGAAVPEVSPYYTPTAPWGQHRIRRVLEGLVDFERVNELAEGDDPPELHIGTVDVNGGEFETFGAAAVTPDVMLASMALPEMFRAVELDDDDHGHAHWDGLFSQNPPIHELMQVSAARKPDELWVLQINPQEREDVPTAMTDIADRRNELSGNLSLNQELRFVEQVNTWLERGHLPEEHFSYTHVHRIGLGRSYDLSSKLDRSPRFVRQLLRLGERRAEEFLDGHETLSQA